MTEDPGRTSGSHTDRRRGEENSFLTSLCSSGRGQTATPASQSLQPQARAGHRLMTQSLKRRKSRRPAAVIGPAPANTRPQISG